MKYTVLWLPDAEQRLASIWIEANQREAITKAANEIDELLKHNPYEHSESREKGRRIIFSSPLGAVIRVNEEDNTVTVINVWKFQERS